MIRLPPSHQRQQPLVLHRPRSAVRLASPRIATRAGRGVWISSVGGQHARPPGRRPVARTSEL